MDTERVAVPAIGPDLAAACPSLAAGTTADAVAGAVPAFVAWPASTEEAAGLLRAAARAGLAVVPRGTGTGFGWGAPPSRCDLVVDLRLSRVYRELRDLEARIDRIEPRETLVPVLDSLEKRTRQMRVPSRNARALYTLRHALTLVRGRLKP